MLIINNKPVTITICILFGIMLLLATVCILFINIYFRYGNLEYKVVNQTDDIVTITQNNIFLAEIAPSAEIVSHVECFFPLYLSCSDKTLRIVAIDKQGKTIFFKEYKYSDLQKMNEIKIMAPKPLIGGARDLFIVNNTANDITVYINGRFVAMFSPLNTIRVGYEIASVQYHIEVINSYNQVIYSNKYTGAELSKINAKFILSDANAPIVQVPEPQYQVCYAPGGTVPVVNKTDEVLILTINDRYYAEIKPGEEIQFDLTSHPLHYEAKSKSGELFLSENYTIYDFYGYDYYNIKRKIIISPLLSRD